MANRTNGGYSGYHNEKYLKKILESNKNIRKYEAGLIVKAFIKTLEYFMTNCIEFSFKDICDFKKVEKKESKCYVRYRDEMEIIPAHTIMKFKVSEKLKDYLNSRGKYKEARHRENLPDGVKRKLDLF